MSKQDAFVEKMKGRLDEWKVEVNRLEEKIKRARTELKTKYRAKLDELQIKVQQAEKTLEKLKSSGGGAWEQMKSETETAWTALKDAISTFKSHYRDDSERKTGE
jgi:predicted nuclease with TOPRIM domain